WLFHCCSGGRRNQGRYWQGEEGCGQGNQGSQGWLPQEVGKHLLTSILSCCRPLSAYFLWVAANRDSIAKETTNNSRGGAEFARIAGERWTNVSDEEKKVGGPVF